MSRDFEHSVRLRINQEVSPKWAWLNKRIPLSPIVACIIAYGILLGLIFVIFSEGKTLLEAMKGVDWYEDDLAAVDNDWEEVRSGLLLHAIIDENVPLIEHLLRLGVDPRSKMPEMAYISLMTGRELILNRAIIPPATQVIIFTLDYPAPPGLPIENLLRSKAVSVTEGTHAAILDMDVSDAPTLLEFAEAYGNPTVLNTLSSRNDAKKGSNSVGFGAGK